MPSCVLCCIMSCLVILCHVTLRHVMSCQITHSLNIVCRILISSITHYLIISLSLYLSTLIRIHPHLPTLIHTCCRREAHESGLQLSTNTPTLRHILWRNRRSHVRKEGVNNQICLLRVPFLLECSLKCSLIKSFVCLLVGCAVVSTVIVFILLNLLVVLSEECVVLSYVMYCIILSYVLSCDVTSRIALHWIALFSLFHTSYLTVAETSPYFHFT